jgi:hypothetical protein
MNIKAIVFSKDRALQLDANLRSFYIHCEDPELTSVNVIYRTSTPEIEYQYQSLVTEYPQVNFIQEENFHSDLEKLVLPFYNHDIQSFFYRSASKLHQLGFLGHPIAPKIERRLRKVGISFQRIAAPAPKGDKYVLFLVDDNLFVRPFKLQTIVGALHSVTNAIGFSLRLGRNTNYAYMLDSKQELPEFEALGDGIVSYEWPHAQYDFNYPLEISSSVFRAAQIMPLLASIAFCNPNTLEGEMAARSQWFVKRYPRLLCFDTSVAFCNPINIVQTVSAGNRAAITHHYTVEELADKYERGNRIDVQAYSGFVSNSCHQEVDLIFKQNEEDVA